MTTQANLRHLPPRTGFILPLAEYERLASEYVAEKFPDEEQLLEYVRLSRFIAWLRRREEEAIGG